MQTPLEKHINDLIATYKTGNHGQFDANNITDGCHAFGELYMHRMMLFIALAKQFPDLAWRYTKNADGAGFEGWFGLGIFPEAGKQITYHIPSAHLHLVSHIKHFDINPYYDGHTSADVIHRLALVGQASPDNALVNANQKLSAQNRVSSIENGKLNARIIELEAQLQFASEKLAKQNSVTPKG